MEIINAQVQTKTRTYMKITTVYGLTAAKL
ncbi:hypothetical protein NEOC65_002276 [Neochlamydia sp. AcF65]|nr:hypothetical protein [Neochlamydia sp. AcF65]MBS4171403.1 hypothetical protein [Neochlamydia sp. AcF95]